MPRTHSDQGALLVAATSSSRRDRSTSLRKLLEGLHRSRRSHRLCAEVGRVALAVRLLVRGLDPLLVDVFAVVKVLRDLRDWMERVCWASVASIGSEALIWLDSAVAPASKEDDLLVPCTLSRASVGLGRTGFLEQAGVLARLIGGLRRSLVPVEEAREHCFDVRVSV